MSSRSTSWNAYQEPMSPGIDDTTTSITVADASNLVAPYGYLVLDPDNPSLREYVRVTNVVGNVLTVQRGLDGSAGAGASAHGDNAPVRAVSVGQWLDDIFDDIEALEALQDDYLLLDGTRAMTGDLDVGGFEINDIGMAVAPLDADGVNFKYLTDEDVLVRAYADAQDLLLLDLAGTRVMTGNLTFNKDLPSVSLFSPDGASFGYILSSLVTDATDTGFDISDRAGQSIINVRGPDYTGGGDANLALLKVSLEFNVDAPIIRAYSADGSTHGYRFVFNVSDTDDFGIQLRDIGGDVLQAWYGPASTAIAQGINVIESYVNHKFVKASPRIDFQSEGRVNKYAILASISDANDFGLQIRDDTDSLMTFTPAGTSGLVGGLEQMRYLTNRFYLKAVAANDTSSATAPPMIIQAADGRVQRGGTSTMATKVDIAPVEGGLDVIDQLEPIKFGTVFDADKGRRFAGFGAEPVAEVIPEAAADESYEDRAILAYLVKAVQELNERTR